MIWKIRLTDANGTFWLRDTRQWSDDVDDGRAFDCEREADRAAGESRASVAQSADWFPTIKVIKFRSKQ